MLSTARNELRPVKRAALPFDSRARVATRTAIAIAVILLAAWVAREFLVALTWAAVHYGYWWGLVLIIPAAGFLLRLFMIQHDCGHGSLSQRGARDS